MSGTPKFKVYDADNNYQAATKRPEEAAAVVSLLGPGSTIRYGHAKVLWREGCEEQPAGDSYDLVARVAYKRAGLT